jgi:hypothetical protein
MSDRHEITCQDVARRVRDGEELDEALADHAASCDVCRTVSDEALASALNSTSQISGATSLKFDELATHIDEQSGWFEGILELSRSARFAILGTAALAVCVIVGLVTLRADWAAYPTGRMVGVLAVFGAGAFASLYESLRPLYVPARSETTVWGAVAALLAVSVAVAALPIAHTSMPVALEGLGAALVPRAVECLLFGAAVGAPILALAALIDRVRPPRKSTALLAAAAAGLVGNAALQLHCPIVHQEHLLLGHATVTVVLIAANLAAYRLFVR